MNLKNYRHLSEIGKRIDHKSVNDYCYTINDEWLRLFLQDPEEYISTVYAFAHYRTPKQCKPQKGYYKLFPNLTYLIVTHGYFIKVVDGVVVEIVAIYVRPKEYIRKRERQRMDAELKALNGETDIDIDLDEIFKDVEF